LIKDNKYNIPVIKLSKTNIEIGDLIGRAHSVSVLAIYELGSAPIKEEAFNVE
jgi:ribosomal protein L30E